jgi:molecular chaperone GrpE
MNEHGYSPRSGVSTDEADIERIVTDEQMSDTSQPDPNEWHDQYIRIRADLENLRKRVVRDRDSARLEAIQDFTLKLLPAKDALERGMDMARTGNEVGSASLMEGVGATLDMLDKAFSDYGILEINPAGERFNPELHEAVAMHNVSGSEPGTVLSVFEKGYQLSGRLIRPAKVLISSEDPPLRS